MEREILLDNEFFKIEKIKGKFEDGTNFIETHWHQYQSPEKTCEELIRLYRLEKR